jgi:hypothetical protein
MRRALPALFALALALALTVPATAATPSPQRMAAQIRTLQKQVKTLQKQVKLVTRNTNTAVALALVGLTYGACETAVTADALQGSRPDQFGSTPVTEYSPLTNTGTACGDLGRATSHTIARQPNTPTVNVFQTLLNIFKP